MNRDPINLRPTARQRYAAGLERPVRRGVLFSRAFWVLGIGCLFIWWCIAQAACAFWKWC